LRLLRKRSFDSACFTIKFRLEMQSLRANTLLLLFVVSITLFHCVSGDAVGSANNAIGTVNKEGGNVINSGGTVAGDADKAVAAAGDAAGKVGDAGKDGLDKAKGFLCSGSTSSILLPIATVVSALGIFARQ
ncbi:hypothetical protein PFISCL1PPCAC_22836, partial [Pristionchus fissidentatus]